MKTVTLSIVFLLISSSLFAQKIRLIEGSLDALKGQKAYNIKFVYDNMKVGRDIPENTYLQDKKTEWEGREKGKGIEFVNNWYNNRVIIAEVRVVGNDRRSAYARFWHYWRNNCPSEYFYGYPV